MRRAGLGRGESHFLFRRPCPGRGESYFSFRRAGLGQGESYFFRMREIKYDTLQIKIL